MLDKLIAEGHIKIVDDEYIGIASDGVEVALGYTWNTEALIKYIQLHPTPDTW